MDSSLARSGNCYLRKMLVFLSTSCWAVCLNKKMNGLPMLPKPTGTGEYVATIFSKFRIKHGSP